MKLPWFLRRPRNIAEAERFVRIIITIAIWLAVINAAGLLATMILISRQHR